MAYSLPSTPCTAFCRAWQGLKSPLNLSHLHPDTVGSDASVFAHRPEDGLHASDQVLRRHIADRVFHAAVGGVVAVVAHHEIVPGWHPIFLGVVVEAVFDQVERRVAHAVRQGLAPLLDTHLAAVVVRLDEIFDPFAPDRDAIDVEDTVDHLNALAGQSDNTLHVIGRWI